MKRHVYRLNEKTGRLALEFYSEKPLVIASTQKEVEDTWQILVGQEVIEMHLPSMFGTQLEHFIDEREDNV